jgi:hypothetical protein
MRKEQFFSTAELKNADNSFFVSEEFKTADRIYPVKKTELTAGGNRCADHATPSIRKSWH